MPIRRTAWACKWKCRKNVDTSRQRMENHEGICFRNPARRACQTCEHFSREQETRYDPNHGGDPGKTDYEIMVQYCEADENINLEEILRCDCELWQPKDGE